MKEKGGIPPDQLSFIFAGKQLKDDQKSSDKDGDDYEKPSGSRQKRKRDVL